MDRVDTGREKIEAEKIVKRTSIRRNSQLRTLCGDVPNPAKSYKLPNSPLSSSAYSSHGGPSYKRREARSPSRNPRYVDKGNKRSPQDGANTRLPQYSRNLRHRDESTLAPSITPPPDVHRHELLTGQSQDTPPTTQTDICQVHMLTAQSSSNNSFGSYAKQEFARYNMRSETQYYHNLAGQQPQSTCHVKTTSSQPRATGLQALVAPREQVCVDRNYSQGTQNEAREPSTTGHVRRMSSGICTSTSVSSNLSARSSSSHNRVPDYDRQGVATNTRLSKPTSAHNHLRYSRPVPKTAYSLPRDHILTSLSGKSPPQLPASSHLVTFSARNKLYRAPQKHRNSDSYAKHGSNTYTSRRSQHASPVEAPEISSPSVLYKSHEALMDYYPFSQEPGARSQRQASRFNNKESHYCTYLHQDAPGHLHVNCQHYKKLVSKETQYSETESLAGKTKTLQQHKVVGSANKHQSSADPSCYNYLSGSSQSRRAAGEECLATATTQESLVCHSQPATIKDVSLRRDDDGDKSCDRCGSDSSHGGFKCDSLLKEILKAVTSKIARPAFEHSAKLQTGPVAQLSKASDETMLESFAETIKTDHDTETPSCLLSKQCNKCADLNQTCHRHLSKSCHINSGKSALPSLVSCSQNNEPSSEQSTVSLEVKSVNLCFRCSNKNAENNSQQIKIKWTTSPHTKATWKAECIEVTGLSNGPARVVTSLTESSLKFGYGELNGRTSEHNTTTKQTETRQHMSTTAAAASKMAENNGALQHVNKTYKVSSPQMVFSNRAKRLLARPSDTTLTSPSPCRSNQSKSRRTASKPRNDNSESTFISAADTKTTHTVGKVYLGHTPEHSSQMATCSTDEDDKCLHRRHSGTQLTVPPTGCHVTHAEVAYRHKCAAKVLARNPQDNLVPAIEDRYLLLQLDWGVFIVLASSIPVLLLLLSLNFYVRASTASPETKPGIS